MFNVALTNLGKYNEGILDYVWLNLPATREEVAEAMEKIGINAQYEEFFISDYDIDIDGISDVLGEYEDVDMLNWLAGLVENMTEYEQKQFESAIECYGYCSNVCDLIDLALNLDNYMLLESVDCDEDLGRYYIEELGCYDLSKMGNLANYIDFERFGRDVRLEEDGFHTDNGYIVCVDSTSDDIDEDAIPDEYKVIRAA